jgi:hypothetical protein
MSEQLQVEVSLRVVLPKELERFYAESGYSPTSVFENRCNSRLRVRTEVPIWFEGIPDGIRRFISRSSGTTGRALLKDLSKTGLAILYHEQMFPEEQFQLQFRNRLFDVTVVRCRRIAPACYEVGGAIDSLTTLAPEEDA